MWGRDEKGVRFGGAQKQRYGFCQPEPPMSQSLPPLLQLLFASSLLFPILQWINPSSKFNHTMLHMMLLSGYGLFNVYSKISFSLFISREKTQLVDDFCLAMAQIGAWRLDFSGWLPKAIGRKKFRRLIIFSTKSQYLQLQTVEVRGYISSTLDYFACVL